MKIVWKNNSEKKSVELTVGSCNLIINGFYVYPTKGDNLTAPTKSEFEIDEILWIVVLPDNRTAMIPVTNLIEEINHVTWRRECNNDFYQYLIERILDKLDNE